MDWIPASTPGFDPAMNFPGEVIYVFDGGIWDGEQIAAIRLPDTEILSIDLVEPAALPSLMEPGDARRALAALHARAAAGAVVLEDGYPLAQSAPPAS